jgi:hypothetical protein
VIIGAEGIGSGYPIRQNLILMKNSNASNRRDLTHDAVEAEPEKKQKTPPSPPTNFENNSEHKTRAYLFYIPASNKISIMFTQKSLCSRSLCGEPHNLTLTRDTAGPA